MKTLILPPVFLLTVAAAIVAQAQNTPATRASLKGLPGIGLSVEPLSADAQRDGLSDGAIRSAVETRLRKAGIRLLTREQQMQMPQRPCLEVRVALSKLAAGEYLYSIHVECAQWVASQANPNLSVAAATPLPARTWSAPNAFGIAPVKEIGSSVQNAVLTMVDEFVEAHANANRSEVASEVPKGKTR
jgi:hypothetical protein